MKKQTTNSNMTQFVQQIETLATLFRVTHIPTHAQLSFPELQVITGMMYRGSMPMGVISKILGIKSTNLSQIMDRLVEKNLVLRERINGDRRVVQVSLSPQGIALGEQNLAYKITYAEQLLAHLEPNDRTQFLQLMTKLAEGIATTA